MKNPLTVMVESYFGGFIVLSVAIFFGIMIYRVSQDLETDDIIFQSQRATIKTVSSTERALMDGWMRENNIKIPEGKGYRYMKVKYPERPWLK